MDKRAKFDNLTDVTPAFPIFMTNSELEQSSHNILDIKVNASGKQGGDLVDFLS